MKDKQKFINWLVNKGCEILPTTNQYEVLRWKGSEVGVIYTSGKTNSPYARQAVSAWKSGKRWNGGPISTGRHKGYKRQKQILIERDGCDCFYCGLPLGDDITVEHLLSLSSGGKNTIGNMVLAHFECNQSAHNKTIAAKVKMALDGRLNNQQI